MQLGGAADQGVGGSLQTGGDGHAEQRPRPGDRREGRGRAEVNNDAVILEVVVGGDGIGDQIAADPIRVLGANLQAGLRAGRADDQRLAVDPRRDHARDALRELGHHAAEHGAVEHAEVQPRPLQKALEQDCILVRHSLADRLHPPVVHPVLPVMHAKDNVGVADVDCQQHRLPSFRLNPLCAVDYR